MRGYVDKLSSTVVQGWAFDARLTNPIMIRVTLDGNILAEGLADKERPNLEDPEGAPVLRGYRFEVGPIEFVKVKDIQVAARSAESEEWKTLPRSKGLIAKLAGKRSHKKAYQDFDGTGSSKSYEKLSRLRVDRINGGNFKGLSVLDIGCNEGFFCREALRLGATRVVGIDSNKIRLNSARERVPDAKFIHSRWSNLPNEKFDVIFFLSAIHYEKEQKKLLSDILMHLNPGGTLILECGIAEVSDEKWFKTAGRSSWHTVMRHDGLKRYPTYDMLTRELLADYAVRTIGRSVDQGGDPVPRWVLHCSPKLHTAILIAAESGTGKTALSFDFDKAGIPSFRLDPLIGQIIRNERYRWSNIFQVLNGHVDINDRLNIREVADIIISKELVEEFIDIVWDEMPREAQQFVIEGESLNRSPILDRLAARLKEGGIRSWVMRPTGL